MIPDDLKSYFKTGYNFHQKTKMSENSYHNWFKWGYIPYASQKKIEKLTNGDLVAVWEHCEQE